MSYVLAFLGFAALIILHEGGHFVAAKAVGMRVERFSLFFGPLVLRRRIGETEYGVGVIPLGGYVKITGMAPGEVYETPEAEARGYMNQPVWKRIVVIVAGPAVNVLIAFLIVGGYFIASGETNYHRGGATVEGIVVGSPAAGVLRPNDEIVAVDGRRLNGGSAEIESVLKQSISADRCAGAQTNGCQGAHPVRLTVRRGRRTFDDVVRPRYSAAAKKPQIGFDYLPGIPAHASIGPAHAASLSGSYLWNATRRTLSAFAHIFQAKDRRQLHSVVGAYTITSKAIAKSTDDAISIIALISLSLGIINLFPFLPLDGGHVFWALAEKVRGRRIPFGVMERASFVGIALVLMIFAIGLGNDISTFAGKGFQLP